MDETVVSVDVEAVETATLVVLDASGVVQSMLFG